MPKRKRRSSVFTRRAKRKSLKPRGRRKTRAKLRGSTRAIAKRALALASEASSAIETKKYSLFFPQVTVPNPKQISNYIGAPTEISTGVNDGNLAVDARVGNSIRAIGLKLHLRVNMHMDAVQQGSTSTLNGEQRVRLIVGLYDGKNRTNTEPRKGNVFNYYPDVFYNSEEFGIDNSRWGHFPKYTKDPHAGAASSSIAPFKILYQRELTFNSLGITNLVGSGSSLELIDDGTNMPVHNAINMRKAPPQSQLIKKWLPLDHEVKYIGPSGGDVASGCVGVWLCQHAENVGYGTNNLSYFGKVDFYYKDA